jgi:DNA-binding NtrC family response regulator
MMITGKTLFAFVDSQDPFVPTMVAGEEQTGPILYLMASRPFNRLVLFHTQRTLTNARDTSSEVARRYPKCQVVLEEFPDSTPEDAISLVGRLSRRIRRVVKASRDSENHVCMSSGTPENRIALGLLLATGVLPAASMLRVGSPMQRLFGAPDIKEVRLDTTEPSNLPDTVTREIDMDSFRLQLNPEPKARYAELDDVIKEHHICIRSAAMRSAAERVADAAPTNLSILLLGKSGTGKDVLANLAWRLSDRRNKALEIVNCAAKSESLLESELFGHVQGAFTGAIRDRQGIFEVADKGTLFLDEIGEFTPGAQAKLLRVLQHGEIQTVGSPRPRKIDVRIIAATNIDVNKAVKEGRFRADLFYRFGIVISLPPLRERREDLLELIGTFLDRSNTKFKRQRQLSQDALAKLLEYPWPGNVRELERVIEESVICAKCDIIEPEDLKFYAIASEQNYLELMPVPQRGFKLTEFLRRVKGYLMQKALDMCNGNQRQAAELLGISKQAVSEFLSETR